MPPEAGKHQNHSPSLLFPLSRNETESSSLGFSEKSEATRCIRYCTFLANQRCHMMRPRKCALSARAYTSFKGGNTAALTQGGIGRFGGTFGVILRGQDRWCTSPLQEPPPKGRLPRCWTRLGPAWLGAVTLQNTPLL